MTRHEMLAPIKSHVFKHKLIGNIEGHSLIFHWCREIVVCYRSNKNRNYIWNLYHNVYIGVNIWSSMWTELMSNAFAHNLSCIIFCFILVRGQISATPLICWQIHASTTERCVVNRSCHSCFIWFNDRVFFGFNRNIPE